MIPLSAKVIAVSGKRELDDSDTPRIHSAVIMFLSVYKELRVIRFGGARGADSVAMIAAHVEADPLVEFDVIVPSTLRDQPEDAQRAVSYCVTGGKRPIRIIELKHPAYNHQRYQARNVELLRGWHHNCQGGPADGLLAFWGADSGGTQNTIRLAASQMIPISIVPLVGAS